MFPISRNQSINLHCKLIDWFLYDGEHWSLMGQMLYHHFLWITMKGFTAAVPQCGDC